MPNQICVFCLQPAKMPRIDSLIHYDMLRMPVFKNFERFFPVPVVGFKEDFDFSITFLIVFSKDDGFPSIC